MKFVSILLKEGRKEDLRAKYIKSMDPEVLDWVLGISDLKDFNHKYTDFVLRTLNKEGEYLEGDIDDVITMLKYFDKHNSQLEKKDINQYESTSELFKAIRPIQEKEHQKVMESQVDRVYEDDKFVVVRPKTYEASCKYGANTKWCTSSQDDQHFKRYTSDGQQLYYIINKANSTNKNYSKVAIHFDSGGYAKYWDSQDSQMNEREIGVLNYAFPEMIQAIDDDFKTYDKQRVIEVLENIFNSKGLSIKSDANFLGKNILAVHIQDFETIPDMEFGHAVSTASIFLNEKMIDGYEVFIMFTILDKNRFKVDVGFSGNDFENETNMVDTELENKGFKVNYSHKNQNPRTTATLIREDIANRVLQFVKSSPKLQEKILGTSKVFTPTYGYTFGKNKGLIKKLVDYLDAEKTGTKLDFLIDIGYLEPVMSDGQKKLRKTKGGFLYNQRDLRGQHASFFAAAKNAGILNYRKVGKDFFLIKGPNFDAFKSGELKAL